MNTTEAAPMTDIEKRVNKVLKNYAGINGDTLTSDTKLVEDLAFDSLEVVEILM